jgi:hypothetical protein
MHIGWKLVKPDQLNRVIAGRTNCELRSFVAGAVLIPRLPTEAFLFEGVLGYCPGRSVLDSEFVDVHLI